MTIAESPVISPEARKQWLEVYISNCVKHGWRVESHSEFSATLAKGHRPNPWFHAIATLLTLGVWLVVWIPRALFFGEKRMAVRVDENGDIQKS